MANYNGNRIGKTNDPSETITGSYTLVEQLFYRRDRVWPPVVAQDGLIFYVDAGLSDSYPGSGAAWFDLSGNNYNAQLYGAQYNSSENGYIVFDGSDDYVGVSSLDTTLNNLISGSDDFSVSCWFNPDSFPSSTGFTYSKMVLNAGPRQLYLVFGDDAPVNRFNVRANQNGTWRSVVQSNALSINTWYNVVVTFSSSTGFIIYQNGTSVDTSNQNGGFGTSNSDPAIGAKDAGGRFFDGKISQVLIYDKVLTTAEVQNNFNVIRGRYGI